MPRRMPTTLRPRFRAQARGGGLLHHVPNRPPRFPTSTPPPGPSTRPSGFSIRSQQDSIGFNPTVFKTPVRTSVATVFNSGEQQYYTKNSAVAASMQQHSHNLQIVGVIKTRSPAGTTYPPLSLNGYVDGEMALGDINLRGMAGERGG